MALSAKVGTFEVTTAAAGNTIVVSDVGFLPKALIFWWTGRSSATDASGAETHRRGFGWAISPTARRALFNQSQHNAATGNCDRGHHDAACIATLTTAGAIEGLVDVQSMDAGGFTLIIDDAFATAFHVHYLALGGTDLADVAVGTFQEPAATGDLDITDVGFEPGLVLIGGVGLTTAPPSQAVHASMTLGAFDASLNNVLLAVAAEDSPTTMDTFSYCRAGECVANISLASPIVTMRMAGTAMLANGFRVNVLERDSSRYLHYLALRGPRFQVGDLLTLTDTTTDIVESGLGIGTPQAVLFLSHAKAASTVDTSQDGDEWSIGAATGPTERRCAATWDEDNIGTSDVATSISYDEVMQGFGTTEAIEEEMDLLSMDSDGFTCRMDDASPAAAFVAYVAFGSAAGTLFEATVAGGLALAGAATREVGKPLAGGLGASAALTKLTSRALAGGASFAGEVTAVRVFLAAVDGAIAFAGALGRLPQKALAGTLALTGALTTTTARALAGALALSGTAAVRAGKALAGTLGLDGALATAAQFVHVLAGGLALAGQTGKRIAQAISGAIGFLGSLVGLNLGQRSPYIDADTAIVAYNAETPAAVAYGAESGAATAYTLETPSSPTYTEEPQP